MSPRRLWYNNRGRKINVLTRSSGAQLSGLRHRLEPTGLPPLWFWSSGCEPRAALGRRCSCSYAFRSSRAVAELSLRSRYAAALGLLLWLRQASRRARHRCCSGSYKSSEARPVHRARFAWRSGTQCADGAWPAVLGRKAGIMDGVCSPRCEGIQRSSSDLGRPAGRA